MVDLLPAVLADDTADRITMRLAIRDKSRLQVRLLTRVFALPFADRLMIAGASAIHGVYLHRRWSDDLDFSVPPEMKSGFFELLVSHGIQLRYRNALIPAYDEPGIVFPTVGLGVDIVRRHYRCSLRRQLQTGFGDGAWVNVPPLADLIADKLECTEVRARATDFADIWWASTAGGLDPMAVRDSFAERNRKYRVEAALSHLDGVATEWKAALRRVTTDIPMYERMRADLQRILPTFQE